MVTRGSKKRPEKRRPRAEDELLLSGNVIKLGRQVAEMRDRVDVLDGRVTDHDEGIKQIKADAAQWGGLNQRLKAVEDKPDPIVVDRDGEVVPVPVGTIALAFFIHDIAAGALIVAGYWLARSAGWLPPGWL